MIELRALKRFTTWLLKSKYTITLADLFILFEVDGCYVRFGWVNVHNFRINKASDYKPTALVYVIFGQLRLGCKFHGRVPYATGALQQRKPPHNSCIQWNDNCVYTNNTDQSNTPIMSLCNILARRKCFSSKITIPRFSPDSVVKNIYFLSDLQ